MNLSGILKVCAIVSVSAVSIIGSVLRSRDEMSGLINQNTSACNSNPYNSNTGEMSMYNNAQSRRFFGGSMQPQPMMNPMMGQQPMRPLTFGSPMPQTFQNPGYNNAMSYQGGFNAQSVYGYTPSGYSRRNMAPAPQQMSNPYANPFVAQNMMNGVYREPTYSQYGYGYDSGVSALYNNTSSYPYGYADNSYQQQPMMNTGYGYSQDPYYYQQPQQQPAVQTLGSYNASLIGSAARYRFWSPQTSGGACTYYGYDENMPSYPMTQQPQPQMMQPQMAPQQPMPQAYPQPMMYHQPVAEFPQQPMGYTDEQLKLFADLDRLKRAEEMKRSFMMTQPSNSPAPAYMRDPMDGRLHNTVRPIDTNNAWYSRDNRPSRPVQIPPQAQQMMRPQQPPQQNVVQAPMPPFMQNGPQNVQNNPPQETGPNADPVLNVMLNSSVPKQDPNGPKSIDEVPVPDIVMTFGQPEEPKQPPQTTGVQPLYTMPEEEPQPQQQPQQQSPMMNAGFSMV